MQRNKHTYYNIFIVVTGILSALFYAWVPFNGDDLAYQQIFYDYYSWPGDYFPRVVAHHWVFSNGRMADKLLIGALSGLPKPVIALIVGLAVSGLLYFSGRFVRNRLWLALALCLFLPWWDITNTATAFNYILTSFATVWALFRLIEQDRNSRLLWLQCLMVFIAMGMHEAAGFPAMLGITYARWKGYVAPNNKALFYSGWVGALFSVASPGNYMRLGGGHIPDDSLPLLLLKSVPAVIILLVVLLLMRKRVKALWHTEWSIFVIAAIAGSGFCAISGIVGRSGWFATIFALIALIKMIPKERWQVPAIVISVLYIVHLGWVTATQYSLNEEYGRLMKEYQQSPDGTVAFTPTMYSDLPYAAMLYRPICAPIPENEYDLQCFDRFYSDGHKHLQYAAPMAPQWRPGLRPKPNNN